MERSNPRSTSLGGRPRFRPMQNKFNFFSTLSIGSKCSTNVRMNVDLLYNLLVVAKTEVETRSDKVDPCTDPTYVSLTIADWQVALVELHISTVEKKDSAAKLLHP